MPNHEAGGENMRHRSFHVCCVVDQGPQYFAKTVRWAFAPGIIWRRSSIV